MTNRTTRLAPSPTGALHLGNARTFLITWAIARQDNWNLLMRVEDIDGPRVKAHAADEAIDTLRWLGIDFDGEMTASVARPRSVPPCHAEACGHADGCFHAR
jgi:glutamyl-tRNA synthetase